MMYPQTSLQPPAKSIFTADFLKIVFLVVLGRGSVRSSPTANEQFASRGWLREEVRKEQL